MFNDFDKSRDIIVFYTPEALVKPHFAGQAILGKTLYKLGYNILFTKCFQNFRRCLVMEMLQVPIEADHPQLKTVCERCKQISVSILDHYGLPAIEIAELMTSEIHRKIQAAVNNAPTDLREFDFDGIPFGKLNGTDFVLATKISDFESVKDKYRSLWLKLIETSLSGYLIVDELCKRLPVKRVLYYSDYGVLLGTRIAASRNNAKAFSVVHASMKNVDRRKFSIVSEVRRYIDKERIKNWERWRDLSLSSQTIRTIGDDVIYRFGAKGTRAYSPAKTTEQDSLFDKLNISQDKKILVAYTSSLDERLACFWTQDAFNILETYSQPFSDQIEWLNAIVEFVEKRNDVQLIVRIHPREGKDQRQSIASQHLLLLEKNFKNSNSKNYRFVWPGDPVSSYDLAEIADVVLTSWSSIGLELASAGIPALMAFAKFSFPHDDFLGWAESPEHYFQKLESKLYNSDSHLLTVAHAYRCQYLFKIAYHIDFDDIIPSADHEDVISFKLPREAKTIEHIVIQGKNIDEINFERLTSLQDEAFCKDEELALKKELRRLIHFLHTGQDNNDEDLNLKVVKVTDSLDETLNQFLSIGNDSNQRFIILHGNFTHYIYNGKVFRRYSPMAARLAPLCGEVEIMEQEEKETLTSDPQNLIKENQVNSPSFSANRIKHRIDVGNLPTAVEYARRLFQEKKYNKSFDIYEQIVDTYPKNSIQILAEVYDCYQKIPQDRYNLYQSRHFDFGIRSGDKILDVGSGHLPFPFATHLTDITLTEHSYGRAGVPFKHIEGKPVFECSVEDMPFEDKEFDFVYCSHVLEHVNDPGKACLELMRTGKRGYIESPTRCKDLWLNTAKISNHRWWLEFINDTLVFTEYTEDEIKGLGSDILLQMNCTPQTIREKAFSSLLPLKCYFTDTMFVWEDSFNYEIYRLGDRKVPEAINASHSSSYKQIEKRIEVTVDDKLKSHKPEQTVEEKPLCLFYTTYYKGFIDSHYRKYPDLSSESHKTQKESLLSDFFGDSDFYSKGLKNAGWDAEDFISNCLPLQQSWAQENGFSGKGLEIVVEQIRQLKPQVVYLHEMGLGTKAFLSAIRPYTELIVGQIACPIFPQTDYSGFDIIISSFPHFVERFRKQGITSYWQPLAFDPRVLEKLPQKGRIYPITFVGGISPTHGKGKEILEKVAESLPVEFWGYGAESLPEISPIRQRHHGEAWGLDMFSLLRQSKITINRHIDVAENYANNMRLFEATGCGALLVTDYKDNLNELFEVGKEVVAYRSPEECAALVKYYLANPKEAEEIARAGQERTLRDHTYAKRMEQTAEILERHLRYKREKNHFPVPDMSKISYGHTLIQQRQISDNMTSAWQSAEIPAKQRSLVQAELNGMYKGKTPPVYQVLTESLRPYTYPGCSILEIGCSSGYYYEILEYLLNKRISYTGADYSDPLIKMAKDYYPKAKFHVADGANLPFKNEEFFVAISSCILLHVPNYQEHIKETVRVAQRFVIAHRTPVCRQRPTQYLKKFAYGVETVELLYNENEIISEFVSNGLKLLKAYQFHANPNQDQYDVTYIFEKRGKTKNPQLIYSNPQPATDKPVLLDIGHHQDWTKQITCILENNKINMDDPVFRDLMANPQKVGLNQEDFEGKNDQQKIEMITGEYFAKIANYAGQIASGLLFNAQWGHVPPEWFDHRHHLMHPEKWFNDYWTASADNVLRVLPLHGSLLELCSGDAFYDYHFYRKRAKEIVCVEINAEVFRHALKLHQSENITYILQSVLEYQPQPSYYDVVSIRGAIEHFSQAGQQAIFKKALEALKLGGWFCGDTPANLEGSSDHNKMLPSHENEWKDEAEMRQELEKVFEHVETYSMVSADRTTLFWRCQK